jgi:proteasome lid subunit RPN8/RPN11
VDPLTAPRIIPGVTRYTITRAVVESSEGFLHEVGQEGNEAVVVWLGKLTEDEHAAVERAYVPEQIPFRGPEGVSVRVPERAITKLIAALAADEQVLVRVHSHPGFAFHSDLDDMNMLVSHAGAISLVVPYFARQGIHLPLCSVNELQEDGSWLELPIDEVERRFAIA